jgi:predicted dehydrogenase
MAASSSLSRRTFLKTLTAGSAGLAARSVPAASYARIRGANERIQVGMIGLGQQARGHLNGLLQEADVQVAGLCDVYQPMLDWAAAKAPQAKTYADFRRLLDDREVDAVFVTTPDHWHALPTVMACDAGKDVYVEKPTARTVRESRLMVEAARRNNRIVQVGTQQRSDAHFQQAVQLVRSGQLGPIAFVRTWNVSNGFPDGFGDVPDSDPPPGLDWEMWLGPAPKVPFNVNRFGIVLDGERFTRWASWRYFFDYGGGMMTDWGVHLLDIVQWAMGVDAPTSVAAMGGKFYLRDNRDTPDTIQATYQYPGFVCVYENRQTSNHPVDGEGYGIEFHGAAGTLYVNRGYFRVTPQPGSKLEAMEVKASGAPKGHRRDFLDSVKSRAVPINDIEIGHRSSSAAMLGNVAYLSGRRIEWDGAQEQVKGDAEANRLLAPTYRGPWHL